MNESCALRATRGDADGEPSGSNRWDNLGVKLDAAFSLTTDCPLSEWRPTERVEIKLAKTVAGTWGKSATLYVWTNQTGFKEVKIPLTQVAAEAKRSMVRPPQPTRKKR